ncbi:MAG: hypothetical protein D6689_01485 [Deltaproteobacteria bacterium]|nr:MAG: hypothetical protein D6689_01485 [Deltaproteobacteria bacterium]
MPTLKDSMCCMCKAPLPAGAAYVRCSVASCNSGRFKLRFCSVACWEAHLPTARHRNADYVRVDPTEANSG